VVVDTIEGEQPAYTRVAGDGYEGMVFGAQVGLPVNAPGGRWTPSRADVERAEALLRADLPRLSASEVAKDPAATEIAARLGSYRRQYVGVRDAESHRRIWINFFPARDAEDGRWETSLVTVRGGGIDYFRLVVDLDEGRCGELDINSRR
jgi:hypothetical protein